MIYDVAIIGGGVAGTAAGITLRKHTQCNVIIIEKDDFQSMRVGETVSASIIPLLAYLNADTDFMDLNPLPSSGNSAAWGTSQLKETISLFGAQGNNWQIDRLQFDKMLLHKYLNLGGKIQKGNFRNAEFSGDSWTLTSSADNSNQERIKARFVIEASGRKCVFVRSLQVKKFALDKLSSVFTYYKLDAPVQSRIFIESCRLGWWYITPLPDNQIIVCLMTDTDIIRSEELFKPAKWLSLLSETEHVSSLVDKENKLSQLFIKPAHTHILSQVYDKSWIATGDAACSFDPISSLGIGHAMSSSIHAARCAIDLLDNKTALAEQYANHILKNLQTYLSIKKDYYNQEQRWKDFPFWKRRHKQI